MKTLQIQTEKKLQPNILIPNAINNLNNIKNVKYVSILEENERKSLSDHQVNEGIWFSRNRKSAESCKLQNKVWY